jgi:peptidoglycan hydrolase CwlO-like protein
MGSYASHLSDQIAAKDARIAELERENAELRKALESARDQMQDAGLFNGLVAYHTRKG